MNDEQKDLFDARRLRQRKQIIHQGAGQLNGKTEWYTPVEYIESARRVMGSIDCDPASNDAAQEIVKAKTYYTVDTNGLSNPWNGNVWLNPPYGAKEMQAFVDCLLGHLSNRKVDQAILLTHNNIDTRWWAKLINSDHCRGWVGTTGRVRFYGETGKYNRSTHGHAFVYFSKDPKHGNRVEQFFDEWESYGHQCYLTRRQARGCVFLVDLSDGAD